MVVLIEATPSIKTLHIEIWQIANIFYNKGYCTAEWSERSGPVWNRSILYSRRNIKSVIEDLSKGKKTE